MSKSMLRGHVRLAKIFLCLGTVAVWASSYVTVESESSLTSHWMLNEANGPSTFDSLASRSGTLRNGVVWTTGRMGAAVSMDGVNDYISLPSLELTGNSMSLAAWVKNSSFPTNVSQRFIAKASNTTEAGSYWVVGQTKVSGQNRLFFRLLSGGQTKTLTASTGNLPLNVWYHVAATYDGTKMRLYLNGAEVGSLSKTGWLSRGTGVPVHIGRSPEGSNYLSGAIDDVRIFRSGLSTYEISKLVELTGSESTPTNPPPTVSLSAPANGASFPPGTTISVSATASVTGGTIAQVQFYAGSTLIGTDTSSPYSASWPNVAAGTYTLKAVATASGGASTTSATRSVTVTSSTTAPTNQPPSVSMTAPSSGASFVAPAAITLSATASDPDGTIAQVQFYRGTTLIGSDTSSPYSFSWLNVAAGSYSLTAVARDNAGATTVSSTRDITVTPLNLLRTAVFTPSSNHATAVDRYVLEIFTAGAETRVANPVATRDLGKPAIINNEIRVDIASTILGLTAGKYVATVTAFGQGGSSQSAASPQFTR